MDERIPVSSAFRTSCYLYPSNETIKIVKFFQKRRPRSFQRFVVRKDKGVSAVTEEIDDMKKVDT